MLCQSRQPCHRVSGLRSANLMMQEAVPTKVLRVAVASLGLTLILAVSDRSIGRPVAHVWSAHGQNRHLLGRQPALAGQSTTRRIHCDHSRPLLVLRHSQ